MAPSKSSKKPRVAPKAAQRRPGGPRIDSAEVRRSRKAALLQLKMGRLAHTIGIASALTLALTAIIAYLLVNWDYLADAPEIVTVLKWVIPLVAGVAVGLVGVLMKWEPYLADHDEPHFIMSFVALAVPLVFLVLIWMDELGYVGLGRPDWLYSASLLGFTLTELSLAMTWEGKSRRKTISMVSAVLPPIILLFPIFLYYTETELAGILPLAYLGSAVSIQLSGSMLHIIASSTSVQEREVLRASDSKLKAQVQELDDKRKAFQYREEALRAREADLETYERRLAEELAAIEEKKAQAKVSEADIEQRMQQVQDTKDRLRQEEPELQGKLESMRLMQVEIDSQRQELDKLAEGLAVREEKVRAHEVKEDRHALDLKAKERDLENELVELRAEEAAFKARSKELEEFEASLDEREKAVAAREGTLEMREMEAASAKAKLGKVSTEKTAVKNLEQQLLLKQEALAEKDIYLRKQEEELKTRSEKAERFSARADKQMNLLVEKEGALLAREKTLAENEARLRTDLETLNARLQEAEALKATVADREKQYLSLAEETRSKASTLSARDDEMERRTATMDRREERIKELEGRVTREREELNSKLRTLLEKEKDLKAKEAEVNLRGAELKAKERELLESVERVEEVREGLPDEEELQRAKVLDLREKRLGEREQEVKARLYQREKELERREQTLQASLRKDIEEMGEEVEEEYAEEKVKTGVERMDDLLMGGMPFGANVTFVGPPFIGKEIGMLLFVAEGLRKGVPVVIVTTSHPPTEVAREIAPMLPTFMEFEQIGLVRWVDASGLQQEDEPDEPARANLVHVDGPADLRGIIEAIDQFAEEFEREEHPYFRLVYMSLSVSITNAPEKTGYQFVQALTSKVRQERAVAVYAVERGMHTEQQLESIQHQMTGAVQFKTEKQKTLLSVQGVGDVQTREWVEYRHTNKALIIGAFSLERIR